MAKKSDLPKHIQDLIDYLSQSNEKANNDLAASYFRKLFGNKFKRESEAKNADGYVQGHFILEVKGKANDWYSGLFQGFAYKRELDFALIVIVTNGVLGIWETNNIPDEIQNIILQRKDASSTIGKDIARKFQNKKEEIRKKALWYDDTLTSLFSPTDKQLAQKIKKFEQVLIKGKKVRSRITVKNFTTIIKEMKKFFNPNDQMKTVRAFYTMIYGWSENSIVELSNKFPTQATLNGEVISSLIEDKRIKFKNFIESYYVDESENTDEFFSKFDKAVDAVDKEFRIKHGMFFTDLDLSKLTMWFVKQTIPDLGKNYIVIDPACGSGNLVTNWRSPLELRHKVVSEIEPELLFAVEKRMKGDAWHNGKFTVVPKVEDNEGLNFLDKSAEEYINILNKALNEKNLTFNKPIAFLCNPPYRGDDDKAASGVDYIVNEEIMKLIGGKSGAERYSCFLAQMKLICDHAADSGLPDDSRLLLFTKSAWLTNRPSFEAIRRSMFSSFDFVDGILVRGPEFFSLKGNFPIAFTIWKYKKSKKRQDMLPTDKVVNLKNLTWLKKSDLTQINWDDKEDADKKCSEIFSNSQIDLIPFGIERKLIKNLDGLKRKDFGRTRKKDQPINSLCGGLPKGDRRLAGGSVYGINTGNYIGFMDDLTPCRVDDDRTNVPWFRLNSQFMDSKRNRCFSGPTDNRGYCATDLDTAKKAFLWYSLARTFVQCSYPLWADAEEIWLPKITKNNEMDIIKYSFAIGLAENECVETIFPANNPVKGSPEVHISNPLAPNNPDSFWSKYMASFFIKSTDSAPDKLVASVKELYEEWDKRFKKSPEIIVSYDAPYFIGNGVLKKHAGIKQIKDYASNENDAKLLALHKNLMSALKDTKEEFSKSILNSEYFNTIINTADVNQRESHPEKFDFADKRLILASTIVKNLSNSTGFGRTKLAKVFYLCDMATKHNLNTIYYRDVAGPIDYKIFFGDEMQIEKSAKAKGYFSTVKSGEKFIYRTESNIHEIDEKLASAFKKDTHLINKIVTLCKNLTREQCEIIATLYACWNDLIIERELITDQKIIAQFRELWTPNKQKFNEERLINALNWMRENHITPVGQKQHTKDRPKK